PSQIRESEALRLAHLAHSTADRLQDDAHPQFSGSFSANVYHESDPPVERVGVFSIVNNFTESTLGGDHFARSVNACFGTSTSSTAATSAVTPQTIHT